MPISQRASTPRPSRAPTTMIAMMVKIPAGDKTSPHEKRHSQRAIPACAGSRVLEP